MLLTLETSDHVISPYCHCPCIHVALITEDMAQPMLQSISSLIPQAVYRLFVVFHPAHPQIKVLMSDINSRSKVSSKNLGFSAFPQLSHHNGLITVQGGFGQDKDYSAC